MMRGMISFGVIVVLMIFNIHGMIQLYRNWNCSIWHKLSLILYTVTLAGCIVYMISSIAIIFLGQIL